MVCICSYLLVSLSKEKLIKTQLHAFYIFLVRYRLETVGMHATVLTVETGKRMAGLLISVSVLK